MEHSCSNPILWTSPQRRDETDVWSKYVRSHFTVFTDKLYLYIIIQNDQLQQTYLGYLLWVAGGYGSMTSMACKNNYKNGPAFQVWPQWSKKNVKKLRETSKIPFLGNPTQIWYLGMSLYKGMNELSVRLQLLEVILPECHCLHHAQL